MLIRRRLWWLVVLIGAGLFAILRLVAIGDPPGPSVIRVVGDDADLWAYTQKRGLLQGVDSAWWVSRDGGSTWSKDRPPSIVIEADVEQEACNATACYRLVDGRGIERQATGGSAWMTEHERPLSETARPVDDWRRDWDEQRSIATTDGPGLDAAAVAAGHHGVLVRSADGSWHHVAVTRPWEYRMRWWLVAIGCTAVLLAGLIGDLLLRHFSRPPVADTSLPSPQGLRKVGV